MATVKYFGHLRDRLATEQETVSVAIGQTAEQLRNILAAAHPAGDFLLEPTIRVVINQQISDWNTELGEEDEIAFLPPFSGG